MKYKHDGEPAPDEEDLTRFFTLGPEDLTLLGGARSDRNRLALALLLMWARAERRVVSDPARLPATVVAFVADQLGISPGVLAGYRRRPATRTAHVAKVCRELGVRPFGPDDEQRLSAFVAENVAHTGNIAARQPAVELGGPVAGADRLDLHPRLAQRSPNSVATKPKATASAGHNSPPL